MTKLKVEEGTDGTASFVDSVFFAVIKQSWIWMDNWRFGAVICNKITFLLITGRNKHTLYIIMFL